MAFQVFAIYLIGASVLVGVEAQDKPEFSRDLQVDTQNGAISLASGFNLYTIAITNKTIKINSTEEKVGSCSLPIDPIEESIIQGTARALLVKRSKQIVVWGVHAEDGDKTHFSLLAINPNPNICNYRFAGQMPEDDRRVAYFPSTRLPLVHGQGFQFLVFFPTQRHCWPCRFNSLAEILEQPAALETESTATTSFHLQPFAERANAAGRAADDWFYAANFPNHTAVLKLVDDAWRVTRRAYVNFTVQAIAANHKVVRNSGTCSTTAGQIICRRLDSKLRVVQSTVMSLNRTVSTVSLEYDAKGNCFVAAVADRNIHVFVHNVDGRLIQSLDFGQIEPGYKVRELRGYVALEKRHYHYCLFVLQYEKLRARHTIKCISLDCYVPDSK